MPDLQELRTARAKAIKDGRDLVDAADKEKRGLNPEEDVRFGKFMDEADGLKSQIERESRLATAEQSLDEIESRALPLEPPGKTPERKAGDPEDRETADKKQTEAENRAFSKFCKSGRHGMGPDEFRALQVDSDTIGGYLVPPEQFVASLIQAIDDLLFVRRLANVQTLMTADSLGVPSLDADPADADWTSEILTGSEDSTMSFGKRALKPAPLAKLLKVSKTLLRKSAIPAEQLVRERLAYKFAVTEEKAFLTGSGALQPLGVFTASDDGISTSRDVSTGNTTTSIKFDGLKEAKYSLKAGYWPRLQWIFHRDAVKQLAKLKDGEGRYIWVDSVVGTEPDRLLGFPVNMSEFAPNTFTTGLYVGILGDFSNYWIADALSMELQRLDELYAATNQVGFIGRLETDGLPVLEEAFARVKLA